MFAIGLKEWVAQGGGSPRALEGPEGRPCPGRSLGPWVRVQADGAGVQSGGTERGRMGPAVDGEGAGYVRLKPIAGSKSWKARFGSVSVVEDASGGRTMRRGSDAELRVLQGLASKAIEPFARESLRGPKKTSLKPIRGRGREEKERLHSEKLQSSLRRAGESGRSLAQQLPKLSAYDARRPARARSPVVEMTASKDEEILEGRSAQMGTPVALEIPPPEEDEHATCLETDVRAEVAALLPDYAGTVGSDPRLFDEGPGKYDPSAALSRRAEKLRKRHEEAMEQFESEVESFRGEMASRAEQIAVACLEELTKGGEEREAAFNGALSDEAMMALEVREVEQVWEATAAMTGPRRQRVAQMGEDLDRLEAERASRFMTMLRGLAAVLMDIRHLDTGEIEHLLEAKAHAMNLAILENRKTKLDVCERLESAEVRSERDLRQRWSERLSEWKRLKHANAIRTVEGVLGSTEVEDSPERRRLVEDFKGQVQRATREKVDALMRDARSEFLEAGGSGRPISVAATARWAEAANEILDEGERGASELMEAVKAVHTHISKVTQGALEELQREVARVGYVEGEEAMAEVLLGPKSKAEQQKSEREAFEEAASNFLADENGQLRVQLERLSRLFQAVAEAWEVHVANTSEQDTEFRHGDKGVDGIRRDGDARLSKLEDAFESTVTSLDACATEAALEAQVHLGLKQLRCIERRYKRISAKIGERLDAQIAVQSTEADRAEIELCDLMGVTPIATPKVDEEAGVEGEAEDAEGAAEEEGTAEDQEAGEEEVELVSGDELSESEDEDGTKDPTLSAVFEQKSPREEAAVDADKGAEDEVQEEQEPAECVVTRSGRSYTVARDALGHLFWDPPTAEEIEAARVAEEERLAAEAEASKGKSKGKPAAKEEPPAEEELEPEPEPEPEPTLYELLPMSGDGEERIFGRVLVDDGVLVGMVDALRVSLLDNYEAKRAEADDELAQFSQDNRDACVKELEQRLRQHRPRAGHLELFTREVRSAELMRQTQVLVRHRAAHARLVQLRVDVRRGAEAAAVSSFDEQLLLLESMNRKLPEATTVSSVKALGQAMRVLQSQTKAQLEHLRSSSAENRAKHANEVEALKVRFDTTELEQRGKYDEATAAEVREELEALVWSHEEHVLKAEAAAIEELIVEKEAQIQACCDSFESIEGHNVEDIEFMEKRAGSFGRFSTKMKAFLSESAGQESKLEEELGRLQRRVFSAEHRRDPGPLLAQLSVVRKSLRARALALEMLAPVGPPPKAAKGAAPVNPALAHCLLMPGGFRVISEGGGEEGEGEGLERFPHEDTEEVLIQLADSGLPKQCAAAVAAAGPEFKEIGDEYYGGTKGDRAPTRPGKIEDDLAGYTATTEARVKKEETRVAEHFKAARSCFRLQVARAIELADLAGPTAMRAFLMGKRKELDASMTLASGLEELEAKFGVTARRAMSMRLKPDLQRPDYAEERERLFADEVARKQAVSDGVEGHNANVKDTLQGAATQFAKDATHLAMHVLHLTDTLVRPDDLVPAGKDEPEAEALPELPELSRAALDTGVPPLPVLKRDDDVDAQEAEPVDASAVEAEKQAALASAAFPWPGRAAAFKGTRYPGTDLKAVALEPVWQALTQELEPEVYAAELAAAAEQMDPKAKKKGAAPKGAAEDTEAPAPLPETTALFTASSTETMAVRDECVGVYMRLVAVSARAQRSGTTQLRAEEAKWAPRWQKMISNLDKAM